MVFLIYTVVLILFVYVLSLANFEIFLNSIPPPEGLNSKTLVFFLQKANIIIAAPYNPTTYLALEKIFNWSEKEWSSGLIHLNPIDDKYFLFHFHSIKLDNQSIY